MTENKEDIVSNIIMPTLKKDFCGIKIQEMLNSFQKETKSKDDSDFFKAIYIYGQIIRCTKNFEEMTKTYYSLMNTVVPYRMRRCYTLRFAFDLLCSDEIDDKKKADYIKLYDELLKLLSDNPNIDSYFSRNIVYSDANMENIMSCIMNSKKEYIEDVSDEDMKEYKKFSLIKETNIKFYHGTSFDNYLKILKDGFIKATDYSNINFVNDKTKQHYKYETGYVYVMDSLDLPLVVGFGGFRDNIIPANYINSIQNSIPEKKSNGHCDISVVFEIDPTNYEVYFRDNIQEFAIKGNISLDDTNVLFFKEGKNITQISENELREEGLFNDLLHE